MSLAAVSKHLRVLESAGLVSRGRDAQYRPAMLDARPLQTASAWIQDYRRFWADSFDALDDVLATMAPPPPRTHRRRGRPVTGITEDGIQIEREFAAPPDAVFAAWTTPEAFSRWFGGKDVQVPLDSLDYRAEPGRSWSARMVLPTAEPSRGPASSSRWIRRRGS